MRDYYLAVDIGASSGRHIIGWVEDGKMVTKEIYRFQNGMQTIHGHLCWDLEQLFHEIVEGMKLCGHQGMIPKTMAVDTWAVDFVLLDENGKMIGDSTGYRDSRTQKMDQEVYKIVSEEELYEHTGIQKQCFNTIYQLMALKTKEPEQLERADCMLMIPDYFHYLLTGVKMQEYTNATTTQLVNVKTGTWDDSLIEKLGYPKCLFQPIYMPGTLVGVLRRELAERVGYSCQVVLPATHDTGSAVLAVPAVKDNVLYISSGTWSLMGTEQKSADCREASRVKNFTNEGGYDHRYRYLKNIMGLWMIQSIKKEWECHGESYSFDEICRRASYETIKSIVDCNDDCFLAPDSMSEAVCTYCRMHHMQIPQTKWELAAVVYNSLANCYKICAEEIEQLRETVYDSIYIVGGGANAEYLNRLTAERTGKTVYAGPSEATAVGNLIAQMIYAGEYKDLKAARQSVYQSFRIKSYES